MEFRGGAGVRAQGGAGRAGPGPGRGAPGLPAPPKPPGRGDTRSSPGKRPPGRPPRYKGDASTFPSSSLCARVCCPTPRPRPQFGRGTPGLPGDPPDRVHAFPGERATGSAAGSSGTASSHASAGESEHLPAWERGWGRESDTTSTPRPAAWAVSPLGRAAAAASCSSSPRLRGARGLRPRRARAAGHQVNPLPSRGGKKK